MDHDPPRPSSPHGGGESDSDTDRDPGGPRDASYWLALAFMTLTPVALLAAIYLWLRSLNA